ncbi:MAG: TonB-dependent receptor plug domain-containing protein, partial [Pseudomonadota bacterium]
MRLYNTPARMAGPVGKNVRTSAHAILRCTAMGVLAAAITAPAASAQAQDDGFLGTIVLGESKREVQTQTAESLTVIDQEELEDRQAGTLAELIDTVPGVNLVNGATSSGSGITIRGYGANGTFGTDQKVLIQVDGATKGAEELYRVGTQLFTDPFLYKTVRVNRGTIGSFEFGSGVIGGVVRLETIDASDVTGGEVGFRVRQALEFTSNGDGLASSTTLAWQPTQQLEFLVNYTRRQLSTRTDGNGVAIAPNAGDINDPSWLVKFKYTFGNDNQHSISFSHTHTDQDQQDVPYDTFGVVNFGNVNRQIENDTFSLAYNYNPASDLIDFSIELVHVDELVFSEAIVGPNPLLDADNRYKTTTLRFKNTAIFTTGAIEHELRAGIEFTRRDRQDATAGSAPGGERDVVAIYVVDDMRIGNWTITPALRFEDQKMTASATAGGGRFDNSALMGGISARYEFNNGFAVFASAAYTENFPIIDDVQNAVLANRSEKSRTLEFGASYAGTDVFTGGDTLAVKVVAYDQSVWDVTSYRSFAPGGSTNRVDRQGLEIEASYALDSGWYADVAANFSTGDARLENGTVQDWRLNPQDDIR